LERIAAIHPPCKRFKGLLRFLELASGDGEQTIEGYRQPLFKLQLLLELFASESERRARAWRRFLLEILQVQTDRVRRLGLSIGEVAKQVHVIHISKSPRELFVNELERPAHGLDADLDEDARR